MPANGHERKVLSSWKEIAQYLGVSVRTAQAWERDRGLPVSRAAGEKPRVWADQEELARWLESLRGRPGWWSEQRFLRLWAVVATAVIVIAGAGYLLSHRTGPPARFRHEFNSLVVIDEQGRECWHKAFDETFGRGSTPEELLACHRAWFGDLDGDGRPELLYTYSPATLERSGETLFCFSDAGREKWRFIPGGNVSSRQGTFPRCFLIAKFALLPAGRDGVRRIVVSSLHSPRFPAQVAVLSHRGAVLGEYWHSGHLGLLQLADLDGDGNQEILLAGISNGYNAATLIALRPGDVGGASLEENPDYQLLGLGPGREMARVLFPRTCINRKFHPYGVPSRLSVHGDLIEVIVSEKAPAPGGVTPEVLYHLNRKLELKDAIAGDGLRAVHSELEAAGQLDHPLTGEEISGLRHLRYVTPPGAGRKPR